MKIYIPLLLLLISCESSTPKQSDSKQTETESMPTTENSEKIDVEGFKKKVTDVSLEFINGYVELCNDGGERDPWIKNHKLLTDDFKKFYQNLVDEAWEADPEMGLDSDPIFDAQDYPEEGFELEKFDEKTGNVVLRGKKWKEFKVTVSISVEDEKCLIAAVGDIQP